MSAHYNVAADQIEADLKVLLEDLSGASIVTISE